MRQKSFLVILSDQLKKLKQKGHSYGPVVKSFLTDIKQRSCVSETLSAPPIMSYDLMKSVNFPSRPLLPAILQDIYTPKADNGLRNLYPQPETLVREVIRQA